jgi:hypothetical protein
MNECESNPCLNEANCIDGVNQYSCTCKDGYEGNHCETGMHNCINIVLMKILFSHCQMCISVYELKVKLTR